MAVIPDPHQFSQLCTNFYPKSCSQLHI